MADGPNHEHNFQNGILNPEANLTEIVRYLRFYKGTDKYQSNLRQYLPKLAHPQYGASFEEFIGDYEDARQKKDLIEAVKAEKSALKLSSEEKEEAKKSILEKVKVTEKASKKAKKD